MDSTNQSTPVGDTQRRAEAADDAIGEVVEAATTSFVAQCIDCERGADMQLFEPPEFGSLVKIKPFGARDASLPSADEQTRAAADDNLNDEADPFAAIPRRGSDGALTATASPPPGTLYAAVSHASMTTLDAGRRPTALGYADEDELRLHQPQIFELITTEFSGVLLAYSDLDRRVRRSLPPRPPRLHSRVHPCDAGEIVALTDDLQFMQRVLKGSAKMEASPYDLCAAILRHAWTVRNFDDAYLRQAGVQLGAMLGSDYEALQIILTSVVG